MFFFRLSFLIASILLLNMTGRAQIRSSLSGQVDDVQGDGIAGATVTVVNKNKDEKSVKTNARGEFVFERLLPGKYLLRVIAEKFGLYENAGIEIKTGESRQLKIVLTVDGIKEEVQVSADSETNTESGSNLSATVIKDEELNDLPDNPEELEAYLQTLAGPAAGPNGGQIYIDGFSNGRLPPKEAIREIRINANPFSAEYERMGLSRIEIFTKPGNNQLRGSAGFTFNDETLNSRNPFALNRAPAQTLNFNGYLSGPIKKNKASYSLDFNRSKLDRNSIVTARILDSNLNIITLNRDYNIPTRRFSVSPRIDYQINEKNTLTARAGFSNSSQENQGVSGFSLLSRAYNSSDSQHNLQLTETAILNSKTINETRFQYEFYKREQIGDNSIPTINVSNSFVGGGSQIGESFNKTSRWEFQNYTTTSFGDNFQHAVKFGIRIRGVKIRDHSESGYGGNFSFTGVRNLAGEILFSSIEQYRQKLLGNSNPIFNPNQFSLTTGNPDASASRTDYGAFFTDDWRIRKNLTVSLGLRYENQTNLRDNFNFAPRLGVAWSPLTKDNKNSRTVFRAAFGMFYERFGENTTLRSRRNDGTSQLIYIVSDSNILGQAIFTNGAVRNVPTAVQIRSSIPLSSTPFRISGDLKAPASIQSVFSVERSLPYRTNLTGMFFMANTYHALRQRNINAPLCPNIQICPSNLTFQQILQLRPDPRNGNIYQVESSGNSQTQQFLLKLNTRLNNLFSFRADYTLSFAKGTVDNFSGANNSSNSMNFPAYSYDLSGEYAPSSFVPRHNLTAGGTMSLPFGLRASPTVIFSSGRRFNIYTGQDTNRDSVFTERPTYTVLRDRCLALKLKNSFCETNGISNLNNVIPRNYGKGPGSFVVNLNLSRTFGIGKVPSPVSSTTGQASIPRTTVSNNRNSNQRGNWYTRLSTVEGRSLYNLTFGVNVRNLFNNVNLLPPQSNLNSPFFGQTISSGGFYGGSGSYNRTIDLTMRLSF